MIPRGMPGPLPAGERLLWQGAPDWRLLARRALHVRKVAAYFGLIVLWVGASAVTRGVPGLLDLARAVGLAAIPLALMLGYAWWVGRTTVYTITDRRVVLHIGLALPVTINLPYARIEAAALNRQADGSGDIALALTGSDRLAYLILWPHARPWRLARAEPMLRALRDVEPVAILLSRALAASADMAAPVLQVQAEHGVPAHAPMAA